METAQETMAQNKALSIFQEGHIIVKYNEA